MLSERERLRLASIEREMRTEAPRLATDLADFGLRWRNRRIALAAVICCLGLVAIVTAADPGAGLALIAIGGFDIARELRWRRRVGESRHGQRR